LKQLQLLKDVVLVTGFHSDKSTAELSFGISTKYFPFGDFAVLSSFFNLCTEAVNIVALLAIEARVSKMFNGFCFVLSIVPMWN
jgi:hypothetical protein